MDLEQRLRAGLVAPDPGAMFTARVMARVGREAARRRRGIFLIGAALVMGAAAATLTWRMSGVQPSQVQGAAIPVEPAAKTVADDAVQPVPEAIDPGAAEAPPAPAFQDIPRYSVRVMSLPHDMQDVSKRFSLEAFHAAMLEELRKVPGLTLRGPGASGQEDGEQADYVLILSSLATTVSQSSGITFRSTDGGNTYTVNQTLNNRTTSVDIDYGPQEATDGGGVNFFTGGRGTMSSIAADGGVISFHAGDSGNAESVVWMEMRVQSAGSASFRYTFPAGVEGTADSPGCNAPDAGLSPECMTPVQLAATQVERLRLQVFPPDAGFQQRVRARLGAATADGRRVLQDLLPLLAGDGGSRLDAATIDALFQYVAGQPPRTRAEVWMALLPVTDPALVGPLVDSLRRDADQQVRLAALANLEANHFSDPVVRRAFEDIDLADSDALVRASARWALHGPAQWRNDVLSALHDPSLPYAARLAPLNSRTAADASPRQSFQMSRLRQTVLQEQQILQPLIVLIRAHLRDPGHAQATSDVLRMLGNVDDPAVFDLFLQLMQEPSLPIQITGVVGNWAANHRNDPRVGASLPLVEPSVPSGLLERMRQIGQ